MRSSFAVFATVLALAFNASNAQAFNLKKLKDNALKTANKGLDRVGDTAKDAADAVGHVGDGIIDDANRKHGYPTTAELKQLLSEAKTVEERRAILLEINVRAAEQRAAGKAAKKK